jgi:hypothetical protein
VLGIHPKDTNDLLNNQPDAAVTPHL